MIKWDEIYVWKSLGSNYQDLKIPFLLLYEKIHYLPTIASREGYGMPMYFILGILAKYFVSQTDVISIYDFQPYIFFMYWYLQLYLSL